MKALITAAGQFGPFTSITQGADRWICDGVEYQFGVIGDATIGEYVAPPPAPKTREELKAERQAKVDAIKVTTQAGNTFDGDEVSQGRMARAVIALSTGLAPSVTWVLADNTAIQATKEELTEALVLAGQAQAAIWVI
jgi:predicted carbohydrate-binding protein with CBM5 and CBM33 domain